MPEYPSLRGAGVSIQLRAATRAAVYHIGCERALSGLRTSEHGENKASHTLTHTALHVQIYSITLGGARAHTCSSRLI